MFDVNNVTEITRDQYLALTPAEYLKDGFRDAAGKLRPELTSVYATAAAVQLEPVSIRELVATLMALGQVLPLTTGTTAARFDAAYHEALETVERLYNARPSAELSRYLTQCAAAVRTEQDLDDLRVHLQAVIRQHAIYAKMREVGPHDSTNAPA